MKPRDLFYSIATGPERRRILLTPIGFIGFSAVLASIFFISFFTDRAFDFSPLFSRKMDLIIGTPLLIAGAFLWCWCVLLFRRARGTPVPFNPPREFVSAGPYAIARNPMLTGVFACLFGLGFIFHSPSMVLIWTPLFIVLNIVLLKRVEEPDLERRFGSAYAEYRQRVPMFIPRMRFARKKDSQRENH